MKGISVLRWICLVMAIGALFVLLIPACSGDDDDDDDDDSVGSGTLIFTANGEEFVREGFTSMDGWDLLFNNLYLNISGPTAYQEVEEESGGMDPLHAGHPHDDIPEGAAHEALTGAFFVDLTLGDGPTELGRVEGAAAGNYNRLNFDIVHVDSESDGYIADHEGFSIVLIGTADKGEDHIDFTIRFTEEMRYINCGPNDDVGVVADGGEGTAEATFHFDHVFGDEGEDPGEEHGVNEIALGFDPLAALAEEGVLDVTQDELGAGLLTGADYNTLIDALRTIGHSGEAHCDMGTFD